MTACIVRVVGIRRGRIPQLSALAALSAVVFLGLATCVGAESRSGGSAKQKKTETQTRGKLAEVDTAAPLSKQYCEAIRDAALEARYARLSGTLREMKRQIELQLTVLEARSQELREWIDRREAFIGRATAQLVGIYSTMRPEAASQQLVLLEPATAAAILGKLDARGASAILNDMPPERAAALASLLAEVSQRDDGRGGP